MTVYFVLQDLKNMEITVQNVNYGYVKVMQL